ncbi:MAG: hypothetical protein KDJ29_11975 [Hyphomicrobiales bacterium]|nr:hypothetical protein [Hyphomicrobiales bacterium]
MVLAPLAIGLGFGYLHLQTRQQIRDQEMVAQFGVAVNATIQEVGVATVKPASSPTDKVARGSRQVCQATFRYSPPHGGAIINRRMLAAPMSICERYKAGDKVKAWVLPADTRVFLLEGDRINPWWSWASLLLFMAFCGFAIVMFRSVLGLSRRSSGATR